jgi:hypothetical protein
MPEINLDKLDARLLDDLAQQLRDGLITQKEHDQQAAWIKGGATKGLVDLMLGDHSK